MKKTDKNRVVLPAEKISGIVLIVSAVIEIALAVIDRFVSVPEILYFIFGYVVMLSLIVNTVSRTDKHKFIKLFTVTAYIICVIALTAIMIFT